MRYPLPYLGRGLKRFKAFFNFLGKLSILIGHLMRGLHLKERLAVPLCFTDHCRAANNRLKHGRGLPLLSSKDVLDKLKMQAGKPGALIDVRNHDSEDTKRAVSSANGGLDIACGVLKSLNREALRGRRENEIVCRDVGRKGGRVDTRGGIKEDVVVASVELF